MAEPIDRTHAKRCLERSRSFQTFKKAYDEKWPLVTVDEKGDTCVNSKVCSTVVKRLDWRTVVRDWQTAYQLCRFGKGGVQCRLPCDFPIKSGSWIYFINVGICVLMCSRKLSYVCDFGDFCS